MSEYMLGAADFEILRLVEEIRSWRKLGHSDAYITESLRTVSNQGCGGQKCSPEMLAAAFTYLRSGTFPQGTQYVTTAAPKTPIAAPKAGSGTMIAVAVGVVALAYVLLGRKS